jgi:hypothetical protein
MNVNAALVEQAQVAYMGECTNITTAAQTGDYLDCSSCSRVSLIIVKAAGGTASFDPTFSVNQATNNSGGGVKALDLTQGGVKVSKKQAATNLLAVGNFSDAAADVAGVGNNEISNDTLAEQSAIYVVDVLTEHLDVANGFDHIQVSTDSPTTNAQLYVCIALMYPMRYQGASVPSVIV